MISEEQMNKFLGLLGCPEILMFEISDSAPLIKRVVNIWRVQKLHTP